MATYSGFNRYQILDDAEAVDAEHWKNIVSAFIDNFVVRDKRERWKHLCIERPDKAGKKSHKIYGDLIWSRGKKMDADTKTTLVKRSKKGVYFEFSGEAWWLSPGDAHQVGEGQESLFLLEDSETAIYFWHEMKEFLFLKPRNEKVR